MDFTGISAILDKYGRQITEAIKTRLVQDGTNATGNTARSVTYEVDKTTLEISFDKNVEAISEGLSPRQSFPTIQSILNWMNAKGIQGRDPRTGRFRRQRVAARYIARAIYTKGTIKRFGYQGTGVLDFAFSTRIQNQLLDELAIEFIKEADDELLNTLRKNGFTDK